MDVLKIGLYIVWGIAFIAWLVSFVLRIKNEDENMTNYMCIFSIVMLSVALINIII